MDFIAGRTLMSSTLSYFRMFTDKFNRFANNNTVTEYFKEKISANKDTINAKLQELSNNFKDARTAMNAKIQKVLDSTDLDEKLLNVATQSKTLVLRMGPDIKILISSLERIASNDPELAKTLNPAIDQLYALHRVASGVLAALNIGQQLATNSSELDTALQNSDFDSIVTNAKEVQDDVFKSLGILEAAGMLPLTLTKDKIDKLNKDIDDSINKAESIKPLLVRKETQIEVTRPVIDATANKPKP